MPDTRDPTEQLYQALQHVRAVHFDPAGRAGDYVALRRVENAYRLEAAIAALANFDPRSLPISEPIAFWLNAYNASVVLAARSCAQGEPVSGIPGLFDRPRLTVAGRAFALDDIEHGMLRGNAPKYGRWSGPLARDDPRLALAPRLYDERVHFALFSACRSSRPLRAFRPEALGDQLEAAVRECVRQEVRVADDGAWIEVPRLFKWYPDDFGGERGVVDFVLARFDDEALIDRVDVRRGDVKLVYTAFDWTLNQRE
ncbi:MAG TPA: DUF547 domain-containing protein [Burkholderiales bacterium]|nr:DUF547 domain-containing protein [Burkholderiales bacterium]